MNNFDVVACWNKIDWREADLNQLSSVTATPGLYRVKLSHVPKNIKCKYIIPACKRLGDLAIVLSDIAEGNWLSIGKTTNIRKRLMQHLGNNPNNNRLTRCFGKLIEENPEHEGLRKIIINSIQVQFTEVDNWLERDLLESYGKAILKPLFDISAEH
jgi:hypothetical protein